MADKEDERKKKPPPPPPPSLSVSNVNADEYFQRLTNFVDTEITTGRMDRNEAQITLAYADDMFNKQGFVQGLPLWHTLFQPEEAADINRFLGQTEERGVFESNYNQILKEAKAQGRSFADIRSLLDREIGKLSKQVPMDRLVFNQLQTQAIQDAISVLSPTELSKYQKDVEIAGGIQAAERGGYRLDVAGERMYPEEILPPEYQKTFQQQLSGMQGSQPYKDWFASRYPSLMSQFTEPTGTKVQKEQAWTSYLSSASQRLQEEYARKSPYQRGERPSAYALPLRKVGF